MWRAFLLVWTMVTSNKELGFVTHPTLGDKTGKVIFSFIITIKKV
jgi:hypothetical protein